MFIQEIKEAIAKETGVAQGSWMMARQMELDPTTGKNTDKPTEWLSHWDDVNRLRISMHQDVMAAAKTKNGELAYKKQVVPAKLNGDGSTARAAYTRYVIITPLNVEAVF